MSGWLQSRKASALFLYVSWIVVCMGIFMAFMWTPWFRQIDSLRAGDLILRVLGGALGIAGAPAALILMVWDGRILPAPRQIADWRQNSMVHHLFRHRLLRFGVVLFYRVPKTHARLGLAYITAPTNSVREMRS
jgi:hypothetical protein